MQFENLNQNSKTKKYIIKQASVLKIILLFLENENYKSGINFFLK